MLYIFFGSDSFSRREALERLKKDLDEDGMLATNTLVYAAGQTPPQEVIAACGTAPFLGKHRLVILEGLLRQAAPAAAAGRSRRRAPQPSGGAGSWQALVHYVDQMPEATTLVIMDGDIATDNPLLAALKPKGDAHEFRAPADNTLPQWIQRRAQTIGLKLDGRAVRLLAELVGGQKIAGGEGVDLWSLASELEKLCVYANGQMVRQEDVRALASPAREQKAYLLADAVVEGRPALATRLLHEMRAQGQPAAVLLATIQGRYRRLAIAREMVDAGASTISVSEKLGARGYALEKLLEQASRCSMTELRAVYARLLQADLDIKSGIYDEDLSLEILVHDLAAGDFRPAHPSLKAGA